MNMDLVIVSGDDAIVVGALPYRHWHHLLLGGNLEHSSAHGHLLWFWGGRRFWDYSSAHCHNRHRGQGPS